MTYMNPKAQSEQQKEKRRTSNKFKMKCVCGSHVLIENIRNHLETAKHIKYENKINNIDELI
jgi:hypothetical protein